MEYVSVIGAIILELVCSVLLINGLIRRNGRIPLVSSIIFVVATTNYILFLPSEWKNGAYILTVIYIRVVYRTSWKESLLTAILSVVIGGIVELICLFPLAFVLKGYWSESIINMVLALVSVFFCLILVKKIPIRYLQKWCKKREIWYIIIVLFSIILMFATIINYNMTLNLELGDYVYIIVSLILLWLLTFRLMKYHYEDRARKKYFKAFESVITQIRSRQHEFQNQLDAVYSLHTLYNEYETLVREQKRYLQKLADYEMPAEVLLLKNPILIAHVYEKITQAQELGLRIRMKIKCSLEKCELDDIYMAEILGILFDNAIQDMERTGQIEFLIFEIEKKDGIIIRMANPHEELKCQEIQKMFELGYSTKGKERGIGLYQLKRLAKKYKLEILVENRLIEGRNYLYFSIMIGRSTPLLI